MPRAAPKNIDELRKEVQHSAPFWADQPWLFLQIRRLSIYATLLLLHTPLTPNTITLIAIAAGILAGALFALGCWVIGIVVLLIAIVLDFSDGEVSRYRGTQSKEGSYLDKVYTFSVHPSPIAGMTIGVYGIHPTSWVLAAGFVDVISIILLCMVTEYARQLAVWKHVWRFLIRLGNEPAFLARELGEKSEPLPGAPAAGIGPADFRSSKLGTFLKRAISGWDFPYIFCFMIVAIILQLAAGEGGTILGVSPAKAFLYFYAITYPPIIGIMLAKNVATNAIEQDYRTATSQIMQVVEKIRRP
jgi:phosphatidylglycerophosphate synthase